MSQSKIEALKNSYRKAAVKQVSLSDIQQILPHVQPLIKPTRDVSIEHKSSSLNLKQQKVPDIFFYQRKIQQLQYEIQNYQLEHQANLVYNKQFNTLGKLFGNEDLQFEQLKQKIQEAILNTNIQSYKNKNNQIFNQNYYHRPGLLSQDEHYSQQILNLTKQQLKDKLIQATRSQFLNILQLGSGIVLQNQSYEQRKRKNVRQMFYQIWGQILTNSQDITSKFHKIQSSKAIQQNQNQFKLSIVQGKANNYQSQILQKNKYISQLADELQRVNTQMIQRTSKMNFYKDNYDILQKQCESITLQNKQLHEQIYQYKKQLMRLQDKIHEFEQKQYQDISQLNNKTQKIQLLQQQLKQVKYNKQKQCKDMILKIDQLMINVNKYDSTINQLQTQKNQMLREVWVYKANIQDLTNKIRYKEEDLMKQKQKYLELQNILKEKQDKFICFGEQNQKRMHQLNQQIITIRQQFDYKQKGFNIKIRQIQQAKQNAQNQLKQLFKQLEMLKDQRHGDSEPHTAVFGGAKLSQQLRTSIIDDRVVQLQQQLNIQQQISQRQINRLGTQLTQTIKNHEQKQSRIKQIQSYIQNIKSINISQQTKIQKLQQQNKISIQQIQILQQQITAYKNRIKQLQDHMQKYYISQTKQKQQLTSNLKKQKQKQKQKQLNNISIISSQKSFFQSASISQTQKYKQKQQQLSKIKSQLQKQIISNKMIQQKLSTSKYQIQQISNRFNQCIQMQQQYKNNINSLQQKLQHAIQECQFQKEYNAELSAKIVLFQAGGKDGNGEQDKATIQKLKNKIVELEGTITQQRKQYNIANINEAFNIKTSNKSLQAIPQKNSHSLQTISLTQLLPQLLPQLQQNIQQIKQQDVHQTQLLQHYTQINKQQQHQLELYKQETLQLHNKIQQLEHTLYLFHQRDKTKHDFQNPSQIQKPTNYQLQNKQQNEQQYNQLQKYINDLQQAGDNKNNHIQQLQQLIKQKQNNIHKLQIQLSTHIQINNNKISQYTQIINNMQHKIQQLQQQIQHSHKKIIQKDKNVSQISSTVTNQMTQINKLIQQIQTIQHNNTNSNELFKQNQQLSRKYHKIQQQLQDTLQQLNTLKIYVTALKEQKQNIKQLNDTLRSQNNSIKEINGVLQQENNGLIRNYHTIESQNKLLLATIHDLNQHISRLNNDVQHSNSNKIMHKYGNNQANRQLHTINQIINSQNQIDQQVYQHKNIQPQHSNQNTICINNQNKSQYNNNDRLVNINVDLRQNLAYKSIQQIQINQAGQQSPINQYKNRPKIQKNSLKYEQLLKQSFEIESGSQKKQDKKQMNSMKLTPQQLVDNNNRNNNNNNNNNEAQQIDSNSSASKTIIWSINKINQSNLQLGSSQKLSQNGSNHVIDNRQPISPINNKDNNNENIKDNNNLDDINNNGNPFFKKPKYIHYDNVQQYNQHKQQVNEQDNIQSESQSNKQKTKQNKKQISQSQQLQSQILSNRSEKSNQSIKDEVPKYTINATNMTQTQPPKYKNQPSTQQLQKITQSQHNRWHNSVTSSQKQSQRQQSSYIDTQHIIDQQLNKLYQQAKNDKNLIQISQPASPNKNNISISIDNNTNNIAKHQPQQHIKSPTNNQNRIQQQSNINSMKTIQINTNKIIIHQQQHNMTNLNSNINSNVNVHHQYNFGQLLLNTDKNINNQSNKIIQQQRQQLQHSQQYKNNISNINSNTNSNNNNNSKSNNIKKQQTKPQISFSNPIVQQDSDENNHQNQQINNTYTNIAHNNQQSYYKLQSDNSKTILQQPFQQIQKQSQQLQNQRKNPSYSFTIKQPQNLSNFSPYQPTYSHQQSSIASQSSIQQSKYIQHRYIANTQLYISPQHSSNRLYTQRNLLGDGSGYQSNMNTQGRVSIISNNNRNYSSRQYSSSIQTQRIDVTPRIVRWQAGSAQNINQPYIKQQHSIKNNQQQSQNSISSPIIDPHSTNKQSTQNYSYNSLLGYYNDNTKRNQASQLNQYSININSINKNQNPSSIKQLPNYSNKFISQHPSLYNGTSKNISQNNNIQKQNSSSNEQMSALSKVIMESGRNNSGTSNFNYSLFNSISYNNPSFYNLSSRQDVSKKQQQIKKQRFDGGLQASSKYVLSQQDMKSNIEHPQSLPQINFQQNQTTFQNNVNRPYNNFNFMPNVIIAQSQTTFKQISQQTPYSIYKSSQQISLKLPSEYNSGINKPNNQLDIHKIIQNQNNVTHRYPAINQTDHSIPINKTPIISKPFSPNNSGFNQYYSTPNLQNSYPAPNKVVIIQPIDKISAHHLSNKNLGSKISLQNSRISQAQQVNANKMSPSFASNKFIQLKSQPLINNSPRSISPSYNNINSISNISQPIQNPSLQIINPSIDKNQINLSPPRQGSYINKKMFQTFNPSANKKISVYTNKLQLQRSQSPPSQRSFSPPSSTIISNKITIQNIQMSPMNNQKQFNMRQSNISYVNPSTVQLKGSRLMNNIRNPNQNNNLYGSNNQIILYANDNRRTQSLQSKFPQRNISKNENQIINVDNTQLISQGNQRSFKNYQSVIQRQRSNITKHQSNSKSNIKQKITLKPISTPPMSSTSIYGIQPPKQNNLYTNSANQQPKSQRFSSRPVTNIENPSKPINLNQNARTQYFMNNSQSQKYQQQQQVFSSKHKIVEGLQASESSGIQIHQRDSAGYCCPNC